MNTRDKLIAALQDSIVPTEEIKSTKTISVVALVLSVISLVIAAFALVYTAFGDNIFCAFGKDKFTFSPCDYEDYEEDDDEGLVF